MAQAFIGRFFSVKTLTRVTFAALSLSVGVAQAQPRNNGATYHNSAPSNWLNGGGG